MWNVDTEDLEVHIFIIQNFCQDISFFCSRLFCQAYLVGIHLIVIPSKVPAPIPCEFIWEKPSKVGASKYISWEFILEMPSKVGAPIIPSKVGAPISCEFMAEMASTSAQQIMKARFGR